MFSVLGLNEFAATICSLIKITRVILVTLVRKIFARRSQSDPIRVHANPVAIMWAYELLPCILLVNRLKTEIGPKYKLHLVDRS